MAGVSPARQAAFSILKAVERGSAHSDDLLRGRAVSKLSPADRNLTTTLVLGVLRWQIALDQRIKRHLTRPNARLDEEVRIALRLGAFQLLCLDRIPARAAIDESVELTKQAGHKFASGMVNAVLRKVAKEAAGSPDDRMAAEAAHPAWMVERWNRFFGEECTCAVCAHDQEAPALAVRLEDAAAEVELIEAGVTLAPGALLTAARVVTAGDVAETGAFAEGRVRVQDEGSQLVAEIAAAAWRGAKTVLDACAAPGGKTLVLAERHPQARILACEISEARLEPMRSRLAGLGARVECRHADAAELDPGESFDLVLADVPCSGTGTLGRNPEIRHRLSVEDLPRQAERQRAILAGCLRALRPGGRLVYSTCSLEPEENEAVVTAGLDGMKDVQIVPVSEVLDRMRDDRVLTEAGAASLRETITRDGFLRLLPGSFGTDGFFVCVLEKR